VDVVSSLTYSHARSGFLLYDYFRSRIDAAGLPSTSPPTPTRVVRARRDPSVNTSIAEGLSGRLEVTREVTRDERLGYVLCYPAGAGVSNRVDDERVGVHTVATGGGARTRSTNGGSKDAGPSHRVAAQLSAGRFAVTLLTRWRTRRHKLLIGWLRP
jgi:hypothetical protein